MFIKNKKSFFLLSGIAVLFLIALAVTVVVLINHFGGYTKTNQYISLVKQLKDIDEERLAKYNPQSQRSVDVKHYTLKIDLFPLQKRIKGDVTITMRLNDPGMKNIVLNFYDNLEIKKVEVNGVNAEYSREEKILSISRTPDNSDSADIRVVYSGTPHSLGFGSFNFGEDNGLPYVYTLSEPIYASTWFPCVDLPDDKALADIYVTNDSSDVSVSNGKLIEVKTVKERRTYHWKTFYPVSTYLIAIYSAPYKTYSEKYISTTRDTLPLLYYALPDEFENAKRDFADHQDYLKTFENLFGPYPFLKEKYSIAEFWWESGAMENQTMTGIGSQFITGMKLFRDMLIHELAHHWWGDAVGPKTWKDIWLNEGFATYSEALYWETQSDSTALQSTMKAKFGTFEKGTLYNPGNYLFGSLVYDKGAWVLHMLRKEVGTEIFFKILREYFKKYEYSNASTEDFKNICEKISGKNLTSFFNQWIYKGEGIIELQCDWNSNWTGKDFSTTISIKQLQKGYDIYKFPLDIKMIFENGNDSLTSTEYVSSKSKEIVLHSSRKPSKVELDPNHWLLAKIETSRGN